MKIIFDNLLGTTEEIDNNGIMLLNAKSKAFDDNFYLGSVSARSFNLHISKEYIEHYDYPAVKIYDDNNNLYAVLNVDKLNTEAKDYYSYELVDDMIKFDFNYDASEIFIGGKTTLKAILQDMCSKADVVLATTTFDFENMEVSWYDNRITAREYLGMIAELNGGFARINKEGELELVKFNNTSSATINLNQCEDFTIGEYHKITRVVFDNGLLVAKYGDTTGNTLYLNTANVFINNEETVETIYNSIKDFEFYSFKTTNNPIPDVIGGEKVTFTDGTNNYPTIAQYEIDYFGGWSGHFELNIKSLVQEETPIKNNDEKYKSLRVEQDRANSRIEIIAEEQDEQGQKVSVLEQSVDQIQTQIQDIPTITAESSGIGTRTLTNLMETKLVELKVHPTDTDILGLFASPLLKASTTLKSLSRGVTFDGDIDSYYKIPDNLYFYNENVYDEFVYDGLEEKIYIIKRVAVDNQGNKSIMSIPEQINYEYQDILINSGDYTIFMDTYPTAYIYIKAMIKNDYTDTFATKMELESSITQTSQEINLEVSKKVDKNEVIASINLTPEEVKIQAEKVNLQGYITATDLSGTGTTTINGSNITTGTISANRVSGGTLQGTTISGNTITGGSINGTTITGSTINGANINVNTDDITQGFKVYSNNNFSSFEIKSMLAQAQYQGQQTIAMGFGTGSIICKSLQANNGAHIGGTSIDGSGLLATDNIIVYDDLSVYGSKNRIVDIENDKKVKLNAYETATPYFGDIGSNRTNKNGECKIEIENIFSQTIEKDDYKVFIQECGDGHLWVEKYKNYFMVKGTPNIEFDWEVKAIQKGYADVRLEEFNEQELKNEK